MAKKIRGGRRAPAPRYRKKRRIPVHVMGKFLYYLRVRER